MARDCARIVNPFDDEPVAFHATPKARRMAVLIARDEADGVWRCRYCRRRVAQADQPSLWGEYPHPELDHIHPRLHGGTNDLLNLVVACQPCNVRKGARLPSELPAQWWATGVRT